MLFNLPLDLYIDLIPLKDENPYIVQNQYIELQKTRNNKFPKEIRHKGLIYHYNITFLLSEGRCGISDVYFRTSYFHTGVREFRFFCRSTFQRILDIGESLCLVQPEFDQISFYDPGYQEKPPKQFCPEVFLEGQLALPITHLSTGHTVFPKNSKKKISKWQKSKSTQTIIQKKSKEEEKLDRISANAELVEKMNKIKVSIKMSSKISDIDD